MLGGGVNKLIKNGPFSVLFFGLAKKGVQREEKQ